MEEKKEIPGMLDLIAEPGFCVINEIITAVNPAAQAMFISAGTSVTELLLTGLEEYRAFQGGTLYLTLSLGNLPHKATVTRVNGADIFLLESEAEAEPFRALALAARELRKPLSGMMLSTDSLLDQEDPALQQTAAQLNQGLYQLLRIIGNMSDSGQYGMGFRPETVEINSLIREISQKAAQLAQPTGITVNFTGLSAPVYSQADPAQLQQAVLNILSNALKFTPAGGTVEIRLTRREQMLQLQITDSGSGIAENVRSGLFRRHLRQPAIEDSRFGIGLGLVLVRNAAANHGGTVLIDQPQNAGTRVTLMLPIRSGSSLHCPVVLPKPIQSYDPFLVALSECLPPEAYR